MVLTGEAVNDVSTSSVWLERSKRKISNSESDLECLIESNSIRLYKTVPPCLALLFSVPGGFHFYSVGW